MQSTVCQASGMPQAQAHPKAFVLDMFSYW